MLCLLNAHDYRGQVPPAPFIRAGAGEALSAVQEGTRVCFRWGGSTGGRKETRGVALTADCARPRSGPAPPRVFMAPHVQPLSAASAWVMGRRRWEEWSALRRGIPPTSPESTRATFLPGSKYGLRPSPLTPLPAFAPIEKAA